MKFVRQFSLLQSINSAKLKILIRNLFFTWNFPFPNFKPLFPQFLFLTGVEETRKKYVQNLKIISLHFLLPLLLRIFQRAFFFKKKNWKKNLLTISNSKWVRLITTVVSIEQFVTYSKKYQLWNWVKPSKEFTATRCEWCISVKYIKMHISFKLQVVILDFLKMCCR